ncbi:MAG: GAF domain-containing protein [Lacunisphaera sp.]
MCARRAGPGRVRHGGTTARNGHRADVHAFPGHIACDSASRSEIVVPLVYEGKLRGVLDLDSPLPGRFDQEDAAGLEEAVRILLRGSDLDRLADRA